MSAVRQAKTSPRCYRAAPGRSLAGLPASSRCFQRNVVESKSAVLGPLDDVAHGVVGRAGSPRPRPGGPACPAGCCWSTCSTRYARPGRSRSTPAGPSWWRRGAVACLTATDQHRTLIWKAVVARQRPCPCTSGNQRPCRRHRKRATYSHAVVEQPWRCLRATRAILFATHELVDVLEARVSPSNTLRGLSAVVATHAPSFAPRPSAVRLTACSPVGTDRSRRSSRSGGTRWDAGSRRSADRVRPSARDRRSRPQRRWSPSRLSLHRSRTPSSPPR